MHGDKLSIFRTAFDNLTRSEACDEVERLLQDKSRLHTVGVKDVALTVASLEDRFLLDFYNGMDLLVVDGRGLMYSSYLLHGVKHGFKEMVGGPGTYYELVRRSESKGYRLYYFGASEENLNLAVNNVKKRHPSILVCGQHNGYINEENISNFLRDIDCARPDIVFVGISSPIREKFLHTYELQLPKCLYFFVGGVFDVEAGKAKIAPKLISYLGLEWLWRVVQEPKRLARRYFRTHTRFLYYFIRELLS